MVVMRLIAMVGNIFLLFVALGIGVGAIAYGFGGVYLLVCGISFASLAWGAYVALGERDADTRDLRTPVRVPSRIN